MRAAASGSQLAQLSGGLSLVKRGALFRRLRLHLSPKGSPQPVGLGMPAPCFMLGLTLWCTPRASRGISCNKSPAETTFLLSPWHRPVLCPSSPVRLFLTSTSPKPHAFEFLTQGLLPGNMIQVTCLREGNYLELSQTLLVSLRHPLEGGLCHCPHSTDEGPQKFRHQLKVTLRERGSHGPRAHTSPIAPAPSCTGILLHADLAAPRNTGL